MPWNRRREAIEENSITQGVIWKQLLIFFFPILLGSFFQQMYNTADAMIVGKFVGKEALAAVGGATGSLINLIVGFFVGLSSGATVILSQFYGARKHQEASDTVHPAAAMALTFGAFLMVAGYALSPTMLRWMGTPAEIFDNAVTYIRIYFLGIIPSLIYNIGSGILRAIGSRSNDVFRIFFAESFVIAMINFVLSLTGTAVICMLINNAVRNQLGLLLTVLNVGFRQVALLLGICLAVAVAASFLPVRKIAAKRPIDAIRDR